MSFPYRIKQKRRKAQAPHAAKNRMRAPDALKKNMRTPKEYTENIKKRIITTEMMEAALFSVNKRAKNWRDKKREYKRRYRGSSCGYGPDYSAKAEAHEKEFYRKKDILLKALKPLCIHRELGGYERTRIRDCDKGYKRDLIADAFAENIVHTGSYVSRHDDWDDDFEYGSCDFWTEQNIVYFYDRVERDAPIFRYYMYYACGSHTFHTPLENEKEAQRIADENGLQIVTIGQIETTGNDPAELMSVNCVDKIVALVESGEYENVIVQDSGCLKEEKRGSRKISEQKLLQLMGFLGRDRKHRRSGSQLPRLIRKNQARLAETKGIISPFSVSPVD